MIFIISKIIPLFLLPPGLFITILVILIFLLRKKRTVAAIRLSVLLMVITYLLSIQPTGVFMIRFLEDSYPPLDLTNEYKADFIVILGGGVIQKSPEEGNMGSLTPDSLKRLVHGYHLSRLYRIPVIVSGGRVLSGDDSESEAEVAMRQLVKLGVEKKRILQEDLSRNTFEQGVLIKKKFSPEKIILVTSAYHMPRSVYCFRKNSIEVIPAPADYKGGRNGFGFISFLPKPEFLETSYTALREYLGFFYYSLRY